MKRSVESPKILIEPSTELVNFVKSLKSNNLSENWSNIRAGKPTAVTNTDKYTEIESFLTSEDIKYLNKIDTDCKMSTNDANDEFYNPKNQLVTTEDIIDVYNLIKKDPDPKCYLHELIKGSKIVLPKNPTVPRNVKLEKRCEMLRNRQSNLEYNKMTMNVDCCRPQEASESIGYHLKEINNQFLMIFQILFSVSATFMFGMYGLKLLLDEGSWFHQFHVRLLVSLAMCSAVVIAELYFVLKNVHQNSKIEEEIERENQSKVRIHSSIRTVRDQDDVKKMK